MFQLGHSYNLNESLLHHVVVQHKCIGQHRYNQKFYVFKLLIYHIITLLKRHARMLKKIFKNLKF